MLHGLVGGSACMCAASAVVQRQWLSGSSLQPRSVIMNMPVICAARLDLFVLVCRCLLPFGARITRLSLLAARFISEIEPLLLLSFTRTWWWCELPVEAGQNWSLAN